MDSEVVEALRRSKSGLRWFYPVIKAKDGTILDGLHRQAADPAWKAVTLSEIDTEEKKALAKVACNFVRREVSAEEKTEMLSALARLGWDSKRIAVETGLSPRTVYRYLPDQFKGEQGPKGPSKKIASLAISEREASPSDEKEQDSSELGKRREPYSRGVSSVASEHRRKADTPSENKLQSLISRTGVKADYNFQIPIDGRFRCSRCQHTWEGDPTNDFPVDCPRCKQVSGGPISYRPDALVDVWLAIEAEGEGSASKGNDKRDAYLIGKGITPVHVPNDCITRHPEVLVQFVSLLHKARETSRS